MHTPFSPHVTHCTIPLWQNEDHKVPTILSPKGDMLMYLQDQAVKQANHGDTELCSKATIALSPWDVQSGWLCGHSKGPPKSRLVNLDGKALTRPQVTKIPGSKFSGATRGSARFASSCWMSRSRLQFQILAGLSIFHPYPVYTSDRSL